MAGGRSFNAMLLHALVLISIYNIASLEVGDAKLIRCVERERRALLAFKQDLSDHHDNLMSSWGDQEECCQWTGIRCSNITGRVIRIDLNGQSLSDDMYPLRGKISPSLLELHHLNYLDLSFNDLSGTHIPNFIGSLTKLTYLRLYDTGLSGGIPYQIGNLSNLRYLDLSNNDDLYMGKLEWLSRLPYLRSLRMSSVNLSNATHWLEAITNAPSLSELDLYNCDLSDAIPSSLPLVNSSASLATLDLGANSFTSSIFRWLFNVSSSLVGVRLSNNVIRGHIPEAFQSMTSLARLEVLDLSYNQFYGTVSPGIGNFTELQTLDLSYNFLEGIIFEAHLLHLSKLQYLDFSFNFFAFNFSPEWSPPFQLDYLYLRSCKLGPQFPGWIRNQKKLQILSISGAGISDVIPNWLCNLTSIIFINLSNNEIRGRLPDLSSCFSDFPGINLSSNHFEGHIPQFTSGLSIVDLSKNMFSGPISFLCASESLTYVDLSNNLLSGELPECMMKLENLTILNLANNSLSRKIPSSMGSLVKIKVLHLQNNSFAGELPSSLKNCSELSTIDLGHNRLSGKIPAWIGENLSNLVLLSLRFNAFYGSIPVEICRLAHIQFLDLSVNNISGTIPNCLNNFTKMAQTTSAESTITYNYDYTSRDGAYSFSTYYDDNARLLWKGNEQVYGTTLGLVRVINLSSNKLMGEIPNEIMDLVGLIALNLSRNCLTGIINQKIGQLKKLDFLDLSRNNLSGGIPTSLSQISDISVLDLSYNNLAGRIPTGTQLQSFEASSYVGNSRLCGPPLTVECPGHGCDNVGTEDDDDGDEVEDKLITRGFILSMGLGFAVGFWGVCSTLMFNTSCRYAYFKLLDNLKDWLYVTIAVNMVRLNRWWLQR